MDNTSLYFKAGFYENVTLRQYEQLSTIAPELFSADTFTKAHMELIFKEQRIDIFQYIVQNRLLNTARLGEDLLPYTRIIEMAKNKIQQFCELLYREELLFITQSIAADILLINIANNNVFIIEYMISKAGELWDPPTWLHERDNTVLLDTDIRFEYDNKQECGEIVELLPPEEEIVERLPLGETVYDIGVLLASSSEDLDDIRDCPSEVVVTEQVYFTERFGAPMDFSNVQVTTVKLLQKHRFSQNIVDFCIINSLHKYTVSDIVELLSDHLTTFIFNHSDSPEISSELMCSLLEKANGQLLCLASAKTVMNLLNRGADVAKLLVDRGVDILRIVERYIHPEINRLINVVDDENRKLFINTIPSKIKRLSCTLDACNIDSDRVLDIVLSIHFRLKWKLPLWKDLECLGDPERRLESVAYDYASTGMFTEKFYRVISVKKFDKIFIKGNIVVYDKLKYETPTMLEAGRTDLFVRIGENHIRPRLAWTRLCHFQHLNTQQLTDVVEHFILYNFPFGKGHDTCLSILLACIESDSVLLVDSVLTKIGVAKHSKELENWFKNRTVKCSGTIVKLLIKHKFPWKPLSLMIIANNEKFTTKQLISIIYPLRNTDNLSYFIKGRFSRSVPRNWNPSFDRWYRKRHVEIVKHLINRSSVSEKIVENIDITPLIMWSISDLRNIFSILMKKSDDTYSETDSDASTSSSSNDIGYPYRKISCPDIINKLLTADQSEWLNRIYAITDIGVELDFSKFTAADLMCHFVNGSTDILRYLIRVGVDVFGLMRSLIDLPTTQIVAWEREVVGDVDFMRDVLRLDTILVELGMEQEEATNIFYSSLNRSH